MILHNNKISDKAEFSEEMLNHGFSIYEVFRVYNGQLLFPGDNLERLANSVKKAQFNIDIRSLNILSKLNYFIRQEYLTEGNIRYVLLFTDEGLDEFIYRIPHQYPTPEQYQSGVDTITLKAVRENAEIKYINVNLREKSDQLIRSEKVYEVLLIDEEDHITEGSRSNLFFIADDTVYTPPLPYVLPGTARKRIIEICRKQNIPVIEQRIPFSSISRYAAAFLSGTSPLVLPIRTINQLKFDPQHPLLHEIMEEYFKLVEMSE